MNSIDIVPADKINLARLIKATLVNLSNITGEEIPAEHFQIKIADFDQRGLRSIIIEPHHRLPGIAEREERACRDFNDKLAEHCKGKLLDPLGAIFEYKERELTEELIEEVFGVSIKEPQPSPRNP